MARTLGDILRRFRPSVAPGPAAPAGVPADRTVEAEAELAVVFAALRAAVAEAATLAEQARVEADRRRQAAVEEAQRIVDDARARLESVRAEAASARLAALDAERVALEAQTRTDIERVGELAAAHLAGLVAAALGGIWATAGLPPAVDAGAEERSA